MMHTNRIAYLFKYSKQKILKGYSVTCRYKYKFPSELMQLQVISYKRKKKNSINLQDILQDILLSSMKSHILFSPPLPPSLF